MKIQNALTLLTAIQFQIQDCNGSCGEISIPESKKHFAVINPSKMCQPMGAVQALLGIEGAMPLIHGSQGCSTYLEVPDVQTLP